MARNEERHRILSFDALASAAGQAVPRRGLIRALASALNGQHLALCLHRVAPLPRASDWQPALNISPTVLDELTELLLESQPRAAHPWLTLTFDDGYEDARAYIASRARHFPQVRFIFFVCPEKLERRAGFRWDAAERLMQRGAEREIVEAMMRGPAQVEVENQRPELQGLGEAPDFALASLEAVRALTTLPNVELGNHTNLHLSATSQPDELIEADYRRSTADFKRLFGPQRHFAFPFGTPRHHFAVRHVAMLRALGSFKIWTTESRPYLPNEEASGDPLPRFPIDGRRDALELGGWLLARTLKSRITGPARV